MTAAVRSPHVAGGRTFAGRMAGDPPVFPTEAGAGAVLRAVDALREDVREDLGHLRDDVREDNVRLEDRFMTAIGDVRREMTANALQHAREHEHEAVERHSAHERFEAFIRKAELEQAKRDGALGVFRFVLEQTSRHAKSIALVLGALAGAALAIQGKITILLAQ